jgi:hypothetical protein
MEFSYKFGLKRIIDEDYNWSTGFDRPPIIRSDGTMVDAESQHGWAPGRAVTPAPLLKHLLTISMAAPAA